MATRHKLQTTGEENGTLTSAPLAGSAVRDGDGARVVQQPAGPRARERLTCARCWHAARAAAAAYPPWEGAPSTNGRSGVPSASLGRRPQCPFVWILSPAVVSRVGACALRARRAPGPWMRCWPGAGPPPPSIRSAKPVCAGGRPCAGREGWSPRGSAVGLCLYATASSDQWALWCTFMFTSKRCKLVKRLWEERARLVGCDEYEGAPEECTHRKAVEATLRRMREPQLELMLLAVRTRGRSSRACVPLAVADAVAEAPHVLCCRLWRWPQLRHHWQLRRMPWCGASPLSDCCNPYHWSIVQRPESPPPPYSRFPQESYTQEDRAPSETPPGGTTIDSDSSWAPQKRGSATSTASATASEAGVRADEPWCTIAYWELNERVGPLFPVRQPWLHVTFDECPTGPKGSGEDALSLHSLTRSKTTPCKEAVARTRAKIGMGVTLLHERDGVWVYNQSEHGVFVNSPTLDGPQVRNLTVFKVPPGYSLRVFDWDRARRYCRCPRALDGPFDPNAVRISFVKGWGPRYSRQAVTALPCSLEVLLRPPAR